MTKEDAVKVASILKRADDGCSHCVGKLIKLAIKTFPDIDWKEIVKDAPEILEELE